MMKVKADIGGVGGAAIADAAPEALGEDDDGEDPDVVASGDIIKEVAEDNDDHCGGAASENDIDTEGAVTPADHEKDTIVAVLAERPEEEDPTAGAATALPGIEEFSMEVVDSVAKSQYELQLKSWTSLAKAQSVSKEVPPRSGKMSLLAWEIDVDGKKALHVGYIHWVSDPKNKNGKGGSCVRTRGGARQQVQRRVFCAIGLATHRLEEHAFFDFSRRYWSQDGKG